MTEVELVPVPAEQPDLALFTGNPAERMRQMQETAAIIVEPLRQRHIVKIGQGEHVRLEGWTMLGNMLGVRPYTLWTRPLLDNDGNREGWEARVEARGLTGETIGAAEAECLYAEQNWKSRDDYMLRSMAQTRAASKALRLSLGFVITLAGFEATPAEEMEGSPFREPDLARDKRQIRAILDKLKKAEVPGFDQEGVDAALGTHYGTKQLSQLNAKDTADLLARLLEKEKEYGL